MEIFSLKDFLSLYLVVFFVLAVDYTIQNYKFLFDTRSIKEEIKAKISDLEMTFVSLFAFIVLIGFSALRVTLVIYVLNIIRRAVGL